MTRTECESTAGKIGQGTSGRVTRHSERANVGGNAQAGIFEAAVIAPDSCREIPFAPATTVLSGEVSAALAEKRSTRGLVGARETWTAKGDSGVRVESKPSQPGVLASIWRPNRATASLLFSVREACKLLIFIAWGARGPEFKSRQPDQIPQRVTD